VPRVIAAAVLLLAVSCSASSSQSLLSEPLPGPTASATSGAQLQALPDLLYETVDFARASTSALGLAFKVKTKTTLVYPPGTILTQDPKSGTLVAPGQTVTLTVSAAPACDPAYPDFCIKPFLGRLRCKDLTQRNFKVLPPDPYNLDPDHNGVGCEQQSRTKGGGASPRPSPTQ
jgi:hypothetical protein